MGVKVHLLKRAAGPLGNFASGSTIEVSEQEAAALVADRAAERIAGMVPYVKPPEPVIAKRETATDKGAAVRRKAVAED